MVFGSLFLGIDSSQESYTSVYKFLNDTLGKRERAHVLDEKFIPVFKIEVSWAMGDSVLLSFYSVPA